MANFKIKAFGITKEILGRKETVIEVDATTVEELKNYLYQTYPKLAGLKSLFIAVNHSYAEAGQTIAETDEIALIPPVSGG
ncbi:MAG TPA: MoaD/ThiS family protein [Chryseosolibacter sp.]